jgi:hypothetical protein
VKWSEWSASHSNVRWGHLAWAAAIYDVEGGTSRDYAPYEDYASESETWNERDLHSPIHYGRWYDPSERHKSRLLVSPYLHCTVYGAQ